MKPSHSLLLASTGVLVVSSLMTTLKLIPLYSQHQNNEATLIEMEERKGALLSRIHTLPAARLQYTQRLIEQGRLASLLVHPDSVSYAILQLSEWCAHYQLSLRRVTALQDTVGSGGPESKVSTPLALLLLLEGRYLDFGLFAEHVSRLPFFFEITDFHIYRESENELLTIEVRAFIRLQKEQYVSSY